MAEHNALLIQKLDGAKLTDDGKHALLKLETAQGELILSVPVEELGAFLEGSVTLLAEHRRRSNDERKNIFPIKSWEVGRMESNDVVLSFKTPSGAELSFAIPAAFVPRLIEVLEHSQSAISAPPSGVTRQ